MNGIAIVTLGFLSLAGATPRAAHAQSRTGPRLSIELPADSMLTRRGPLIRATGMLSRERTQTLLQAGFPARFHFRVELWSEGRLWLDQLERASEFYVFVRYLNVEKKYEVIQVQGDHPLSLGKVGSIADAEAAVGRAYAPPVTAAPISARQYYQVTLVVEALSERDLDEIGRWLQGDVEPGITGEAHPASIVSRGLRTLASRLLGGEKLAYEATSPSFRILLPR